MQDAPLVRVMHGAGDRGHQPRGGLRVGRILGQPPGQAAPANQLHAQVAPAPVLADLVDWDDVRVVQRGDRLGLDLEAAQLLGVGQVA